MAVQFDQLELAFGPFHRLDERVVAFQRFSGVGHLRFAHSVVFPQ